MGKENKDIKKNIAKDNAESPSQPYRRRFDQLKTARSSYDPHWRDILDYTSPRKGKYLTGANEANKTNKGSKRHRRIINGSAGSANRIQSAGLQGGLTSPSRPWFALAIDNLDLMEFAPVKEWLYSVKMILLSICARSNAYGSLHGIYTELGLVGTAAMMIEEDFETVIRCRPFTVGEYWLALDSKFRADTLYRKYVLSARQLVKEFGEDKVPLVVKQAFLNNSSERPFEVTHAIQPKLDFDLTKADYRGKAFESVTYLTENADTEKSILRVSGYETRPFVAPRWDVSGVDTYGDDCPGMIALGDTKMLQKLENKKLKALDKHVDPPMNAPVELKGKGATIISGGVTYLDVQQGKQGFTPTYQVDPKTQEIAFEIDRVERRIQRFYFNDLFLAIINESKTMTATEVAERHEEKLMMLGPVIERLEAELLDPFIDRIYYIANRLGLIPPMPDELVEQPIKIVYTSLLAQAQKMMGISTIERTAVFVANMMIPINPEAADKFDVDEAIDRHGDMTGLPPTIIRTDEAVRAIREIKAKQVLAASMVENGPGLADAAKKLSETKLGEGNALEAVNEQNKGS